MVKRFEESGHPVFQSISALSRGILKRKNNRDTIHFTADATNTELLYRTIHSANQLSIYGAVACSDETSDRLTKTENEQILKEVRPQDSSLEGEKALFERLSMPRPVPKIVLKSSRQTHQQQYTSESASSRNRCAKWKESRKRIKATRQKTRRNPASGNWMRETRQLLKKSLNLNSTSESKELHTM